MNLINVISMDYGDLYAIQSDFTTEWLITKDGNQSPIACIDIKGESILFTLNCPKLSPIDMLHLTLIMAQVATQYKQLQTN